MLGRGLDRGWSLDVFTAPVLWLGAWCQLLTLCSPRLAPLIL